MNEAWVRQEKTALTSATDGHQVLATDGKRLLWLRVVLDPSGARFFAVLLRPDSRPIVLAEEDISHPGSRWEIRSSGLWADQNCEDPMVHWSYGLEAFALALDDPAQLVRDGVGDRVPIGWELDFEASTEPTAIADGYSQIGRMHGLLLTADGTSDFAGAAIRQHWWGSAATPEQIAIDGHWGSAEHPASPHNRAEVPIGQQTWVAELSARGARLGLS